MDAKTEILDRIRAVGPIPSREVPRNYRLHGDGHDVIAEMVEMLEDYSAEVVRVKSAGIPDAVADYMAKDDVKSVVVAAGVPAAWKEAAGRDDRVVKEDNPPLSNQELNETDAVLVASRCGISLSGTIVLDHQADQGRRAISLVPDTLIVVLRASTVFATVPEAVALLSEHPERPTTWIAGPSATSDIELVRVNGVHGPRNLRVVIVEDE